MGLLQLILLLHRNHIQEPLLILKSFNILFKKIWDQFYKWDDAYKNLFHNLRI